MQAPLKGENCHIRAMGTGLDDVVTEWTWQNAWWRKLAHVWINQAKIQEGSLASRSARGLNVVRINPINCAVEVIYLGEFIG